MGFIKQLLTGGRHPVEVSELYGDIIWIILDNRFYRDSIRCHGI